MVKNSQCDYMVFLGLVSPLIVFIVAFIVLSGVFFGKKLMTFAQEAHITKSDIFVIFK